MDMLMVGRFFVVISSLLGLGLEARAIFSSRESWPDVVFVWELASMPEKIGMTAMFVVPICFYVFCLSTCFCRPRKATFISLTILIAILALPVFTVLGQKYSIIGRNALWIGFWWIPVFFDAVSTKKKTSLAMIPIDPGGEDSDRIAS